MDAERSYSDLYEDALRLAAGAHSQQTRKGTAVPYITHPVHVSVILLRHGFPREVAIAGLLHDVVEDQGVELAEIERRFGAQVAQIVAALSERKLDAQGQKRPWEERKQEALDHLQQASLAAVAVKAADALHNARCTALDARRAGPAVWSRFARGPALMLANYRRMLQLVQERIGAHPLAVELAEAVEDLAQAMTEGVERPAP